MGSCKNFAFMKGRVNDNYTNDLLVIFLLDINTSQVISPPRYVLIFVDLFTLRG